MKVGALAAGGLMLSTKPGNAAESGEFTLPELGFAFGALEPYIDAQTMEVHHGKHHAGYVSKLNEAVGKSKDLKGKSLDELLGNLPEIQDESLMTTLRNNGGGHWNHSFFWETLAPEGKTGKASDELTTAINSGFGSMENMQKEFEAAATGRFGSGWAWLIEQDGKLKITSTPNQDNPLMKGVVPDPELGRPLLGLDVWEHAYYLNYQNRRGEYASAFWNVVNWEAISRRLG